MVSRTSPTISFYDPWPDWNTISRCYGANSSSTVTIPNIWYDPWPQWSTTASVTSATNIVWTQWARIINCCETDHGHRSVRRAVSQAAIREPTAEELQARLREEQERRQRYESQLREEKQARERAEALLRQHLSLEQIETLEGRGAFRLESISRDGSRKVYEITRGRSGNVYLLNQKGERVERFCIHPSDLVPDADTMLTQKLLLESNEDLFLRTANRTPLVPVRAPARASAAG